MLYHLRTPLVFASIALMPSLAVAQEGAAVTVTESEEHGSYLTDADGRALYLFESDTRAEGDAEAQVSCSSECRERWPAFYTQGEPQAGGGADASLMGTTNHEGQMIVTYSGWPLYYFVEDTAAGDTKGHDIEEFGAEWYLVTPEGEKVED